MSDLFSPPTPPYEGFRLFGSEDGATSRWLAARSLEEARALLESGRHFSGWVEEKDPEALFVRRPSPAIAFLRFRRGYLGPPAAAILLSEPVRRRIPGPGA